MFKFVNIFNLNYLLLNGYLCLLIYLFILRHNSIITYQFFTILYNTSLSSCKVYICKTLLNSVTKINCIRYNNVYNN